jgi:histidine ammonia-lyase
VATVAVDGATLRCADVVRVARAGDDVELAADALERAARAHELAVEISAKRAVYGRTTGVGANRHEVESRLAGGSPAPVIL